MDYFVDTIDRQILKQEQKVKDETFILNLLRASKSPAVCGTLRSLMCIDINQSNHSNHSNNLTPVPLTRQSNDYQDVTTSNFATPQPQPTPPTPQAPPRRAPVMETPQTSEPPRPSKKKVSFEAPKREKPNPLEYMNKDLDGEEESVRDLLFDTSSIWSHRQTCREQYEECKKLEEENAKTHPPKEIFTPESSQNNLDEIEPTPEHRAVSPEQRQIQMSAVSPDENSENPENTNINPLLSISKSEREAVLYQIYMKARHNVKSLNNLTPEEEATKIKEHSDRLLEIWVNNRKK